MTATPQRTLHGCQSSAAGGAYVCSLIVGHTDDHECREFGHAARVLLASWPDWDGDDEPMWCAHEEDEHVEGDLHRCTRCGSVRLEIADPTNGTTWIETFDPRTRRKVRYECAICGVIGCHGCPPPPVLRGHLPTAAEATTDV